jgi:hypothetical protein
MLIDEGWEIMSFSSGPAGRPGTRAAAPCQVACRSAATRSWTEVATTGRSLTAARSPPRRASRLCQGRCLDCVRADVCDCPCRRPMLGVEAPSAGEGSGCGRAACCLRCPFSAAAPWHREEPGGHQPPPRVRPAPAPRPPGPPALEHLRRDNTMITTNTAAVSAKYYHTCARTGPMARIGSSVSGAEA